MDDKQNYHCCMCGAMHDTAVCQACGHQFCKDCRDRWFDRGVAAVRERLGRSVLHCQGVS